LLEVHELLEPVLGIDIMDPDIQPGGVFFFQRLEDPVNDTLTFATGAGAEKVYRQAPGTVYPERGNTYE
jgi:hypothetical protein